MIDISNNHYIHNNPKYDTLCFNNSELLNWFASCLQCNNLSFDKLSSSKSKNYSNDYKARPSLSWKPNAWISNGKEIMFRKAGIDYKPLKAIPIHYLTKGRVFRPIREANDSNNLLINYLTNYLKSQQLISLSNICVSNNYLNNNNCNNTGADNLDYEIISNDLTSYSDNIDHNSLKCFCNNLNNPYLDEDEHIINCINGSTIGDSRYTESNNLQFNNVSTYSDDLNQIFKESQDDCNNVKNVESGAGHSVEYYTFKNLPCNGNSKTPSYSANSRNSSIEKNVKIIYCNNKKITKPIYVSVKNDPLDIDFAKWYNEYGSSDSEWKRIRRGVYNVEGKLVNLALVSGKLYVKIVDEFTKKPYNMLISEYMNKYINKI